MIDKIRLIKYIPCICIAVPRFNGSFWWWFIISLRFRGRPFCAVPFVPVKNGGDSEFDSLHIDNFIVESSTNEKKTNKQIWEDWLKIMEIDLRKGRWRIKIQHSAKEKNQLQHHWCFTVMRKTWHENKTKGEAFVYVDRREKTTKSRRDSLDERSKNEKNWDRTKFTFGFCFLVLFCLFFVLICCFWCAKFCFLPQNISIIMFATKYAATAYSCCITGTQMNTTKYATKTANMEH